MMRQRDEGNSPEIIGVVTLYQGVVDEVRIFYPGSGELETYRAQWLAEHGYSSWEVYRQDAEHGMPNGEFIEVGVALPPGSKFVVVNHAHPWGWTVLNENDRGIYDIFQEAMADAIYAAQEYDNDRLRVHLVGPAVFDPAGWALCDECREVYPEGAPHTCEEVEDASQ